MAWINFDSKPKLFASLGLTLIFFGLITFLGYLWVVDQQNDKFMDMVLKIEGLGDKLDERIVESTITLLGKKAETVSSLSNPAITISVTFMVGGLILFIIGIVTWKDD